MSAVSTDSFPLTAAQLVGNFCETLFYGMYLVTCAFCARTLLLAGSGREERWLRLNEIRWMMASIAFTLFVICTFDVAIGLLHNFHAFIDARDAKTEFHTISGWIDIARSVNQVVVAILGDFVLIYRYWVVYGRRWLVAVPSLTLYLACLAMGVRLIVIETNSSTSPEISLSSSQVRAWYSAFFATTVVQNILTTGILIWRIWSVEKEIERCMDNGSTSNRPRHLRKVIRVIAESGVAYTLSMFLTFIAGILQKNALYPVSDMALQATGITFNVLLVRCSTKRDQQLMTVDHHDLTTIIWERNSENTMSRSIKLSPGQNGSRDVELAMKKDNGMDRTEFKLPIGHKRIDVKVMTTVEQS